VSRHSGTAANGIRRAVAQMEPPQWILAALGAVLVVVGVVELLTAGLVWVYLVHVVAGAAALAIAPRRSWAKPGAVLLGAVFLILYIVESASPELVGDDPNPSSNASLILTGFVLLAIMVAFMWPWRVPSRRRGTRS
jgi:hypothetical protein